eukprot:TRINITY_DN2090_c0_g1_i1.p1 TRINITY_DN2090_c0_g1~~TRINITY_DN2090_c0_g1_i1.p1  ORF type:complete len:212 (+),score=36.19 TRINITY_DN2090_c0_g1_i1:44-637(+)
MEAVDNTTAGLKAKFSETPWHITPTKSYGILGWFQSGIRLLSMVVSLFSWIKFVVDGERSKAELRELIPERIALVVMFSLLLAVYIWKLALCIISAEVFAMILHVMLMLSTLLMLINSILQFDPSEYVFLFGLCLALAEILQIMFLFMRSNDHLEQVYTLQPKILWAYSLVVVILYISILITQSVIYTSTYQQFYGY